MRVNVPVIVVAACLLVASSGCGSREGERAPVPSRPGPPPTVSVAAPTPASTAPSSWARKIALGLTPVNPDAQSRIRAGLIVASGTPAIVERVRWIVNGEPLESEGMRLAGRPLRRGDVVSAKAEVRVGAERFVVSSSDVTIGNSLPEATSAELVPATPKAGDSLRAVARGRDADGDPVSFRYRWFVNGKESPGDNTSLFTVRKGSRDAWIHAEVEAHDGIAEGSRLFTPKAQVLNAPPAVEKVDMGRDGNRFTATVRVSDPDGDPVALQAKSLPHGVSLSGNVLSWEVSAIPPGTDAPVVLVLSDGYGGDVEYSFRLVSSQK